METREGTMELRSPCHELVLADQFKAFEVPAEIIFCDKSVARWNGLTFDIDYSRMASLTDLNDADRFVASKQRKTARDAVVAAVSP